MGAQDGSGDRTMVVSLILGALAFTYMRREPTVSSSAHLAF